MVNHYGGSEGFLGWLALSPRRHVLSLGALTDTEAKALGISITRIELALTAYWPLAFGEALARVYVVHFFEGAALGDREPWHLHFHIIPRPVSFHSEWWAWNVPSASKSTEFPTVYSKTNEDFERCSQALLDYLRAAITAAA